MDSRPKEGAEHVTLSFLDGTIELRGFGEEGRPPPSAAFTWDPREACFRAPAVSYAEAVLALRAQKIVFEDTARRYPPFESPPVVQRAARPYQAEALSAWVRARSRGVVVLPTGAGKTHLATMAIAEKKRSTLVVAPTLDLVRQWHDTLSTTFGTKVGIVGGGEHTILPLTITTYDSAYLHMGHMGARFGLIVFDECHHLPSAGYAHAAKGAIAPFRLGLTATPERADGGEARLDYLIGPTIYRKDIIELSGDYLSEYDVETVSIELSPDEREVHDNERAIYLSFLKANGIRMSGTTGWADFVIASSQSDAGRRAMKAYQTQRAIAFAPRGKLEYLRLLIDTHKGDRTIVFTQDNATAYGISRELLLPCITHQTKVRERSEILREFSAGTYRGVVTSKVLNEGVDVPDANVAVVLSGSGSIREHVQRLGRILRQRDGKRALLYELVTAATTEVYTSERRRAHSAYA